MQYRGFESRPHRHLLSRRISLSAFSIRENGAEFGRFARGNGTFARPRSALLRQISLFLSAVSLLQRNLRRSGSVSIPLKINSLHGRGAISFRANSDQALSSL
jgi:hypothetical protein